MSGGDIQIRRTSTVFVAMTDTREKPFLRYEIDETLGIMRLIETYVPPEMRGRGIAKKLVDAALAYAEERGLKVEPICSYAIYYFIRFPQKRGLLVEWLREKSDEELKRLFEYRRSLEGSK